MCMEMYIYGCIDYKQHRRKRASAWNIKNPPCHDACFVDVGQISSFYIMASLIVAILSTQLYVIKVGPTDNPLYTTLDKHTVEPLRLYALCGTRRRLWEIVD